MMGYSMIYLRWIGTMIIKLLAWTYSFVVWPIAFLNRKAIRDVYRNSSSKLMRALAWTQWIVLDDQEDYGEDWWLKNNRLKRNFLTAWRWSWARNNSWNLNQWLRVTNGHYLEVMIKGWTTSDKQTPYEHNRFKWQVIDDHGNILEGWDINQGNRLSEKYTSLGKSFLIYSHENDHRKYFRASGALIKCGFMINYKLGWNKNGEALIDLKVKRYKPYYTAHWAVPVKVLILMSSILIQFSCSKDDPCVCTKYTKESFDVWQLKNVGCEDEMQGTDDRGKYFIIECN